MTNPKVIIIGAGAAGIGAAMQLRAQGVSHVILEAADRVGGRAFTDTHSLPGQWDQGCQWFHCADVNPLVAWADRLGTVYEAKDRSDKAMIWATGGWIDAAGVGAMGEAIDQTFSAVYDAAKSEPDRPISEVIPDTGPWAPFMRLLLQYMACDDPEKISSKGYSQYDDTGLDLIVTSGYGDLIGRMAAGMPLRLGVQVTGIRHRPGGVAVQTNAGELSAKAVIVTTSTNVLTSGAIKFGPCAARELLDQIAGVPCGTYEKVAFALKSLPDQITDQAFCWIDPGAGALPGGFQITSGAQPKIIAHLAGSPARDLIDAGEATMTAAALEGLVAAFGSDIGHQILGSAVTGWQKNPLTRGGYSYCRSGMAGQRLAMIAAETGNIAFAGEAFSAQFQATAHGAWASGQDVAARLIRSERLV